MLVSSKNKFLGPILLFLSVAFTLASLFVFADGWERSSGFFLAVGAALAVASLFAFAVGWDMLKSSRNSGRIAGKLRFPRLGYPLTFHPRVALGSIDGSNRTTVPSRADGSFELVGVVPGEYRVSVEGYGLSSVTRPATIAPGRTTDVGEVVLEFDPEQFWRHESLPPAGLGYTFGMRRIGPGPAGSAWVAGFRTEERSMRQEYKVFRRQGNPPMWREILVPAFAKQGTHILAMSLFSDGTFLLGSLFGGAAVSSDGARSWRALDIPGVRTVSEAVELPDGAWLLAGHTSTSYVFVKSFDRGASWRTVWEQEEEVSSVLLTSSGRFLAGTSSLNDRARVFVSNDLGDSWEEASIADTKRLRGIHTLYELRNGYILAGNVDGRGWKGEWYRGGQLLISRDGGVQWETLVERSEWRGVMGIYESANGHLFVWADADTYVDHDNNEYVEPYDLLVSLDRGRNWHPFSPTFGRGVDETYSVVGSEVFVLSDRHYGQPSILVTSTDTLDFKLD